jgi:altronate dehydratase small subunit
MADKRAIALHSQDNTAVAAQDIEPGDRVKVEAKDGGTSSLAATEQVPFGFKIALTNIAQGDKLFKYGQVMGYATKDIPAGAQVHVHNAQGLRVKD